MVQIDDTTHFDFFDFSIMSPLYARLGVLGKIDGDEMVGIIGRYSLAFFNSVLKGQHSALLESAHPKEFPEVKMQSRDPRQVDSGSLIRVQAWKASIKQQADCDECWYT